MNVLPLPTNKLGVPSCTAIACFPEDPVLSERHVTEMESFYMQVEAV